MLFSIKADTIKKDLALHQRWLDKKIGGKKLVINDVDLAQFSYLIERANLSYAVFNNCNFKYMNLSHTQLFNTKFIGCDLSNVKFADISLPLSNLTGSIL